jgi:hypothetical protein
MTTQDIINILNSINASIPPKPKYVLIASEFIVDLIVKNSDSVFNFEYDFWIYRTPYHNINIRIEHTLQGYEAILFKDGKVKVTIDKEGKGKIFE